MTTTPVGMRCPECARERTRVHNPTGLATRADAPVTFAIVGLCIAAFIAEIIGGADLLDGRPAGSVLIDGGLIAYALEGFGGQEIGVAEGEPYRIVTSAFLHSGLPHLALNMFALFILGRLLEPAIGSLRFAGIYLVSILAGSCGALLLDPNQLTVGASGGVFGMMAAAFLIARHRGLDELASQIGFFVVLNLVFTFSVPGISIGGHLGGLIGGALAALLMTRLERRRVANGKLLEGVGLAALSVIAAVAALLAAQAGAPPTMA